MGQGSKAGDVNLVVANRLWSRGPKRMLALDGGGVRGAVTIAFLERIEAELRRQHGRPDMVLSDYFDLIGGTSVGSILAVQLALGEPVETLRSRFEEWAPDIFSYRWYNALARIPRLGGVFFPRFNGGALKRRLDESLGGLMLGSTAFKTGLAIVCKRADKGSPWVLTNNPFSKYWDGGEFNGFPNREYRVADLVRASTAAPSVFAPKRLPILDERSGNPALFVDGGVSPYNNPALQMFMLAALRGHRLNWPLGADKLLLVSVGTGSYRHTAKPNRIAALHAVDALRSIIADNEVLAVKLLQWMSQPTKSWPINLEVGDLRDDVLGLHAEVAVPLLSFQRYDLRLEAEWLLDQLDERVSLANLKQLQDFTNPQSLPQLQRLGAAAADRYVDGYDFPAVFKCNPREEPA